VERFQSRLILANWDDKKWSLARDKILDEVKGLDSRVKDLQRSVDEAKEEILAGQREIAEKVDSLDEQMASR